MNEYIKQTIQSSIEAKQSYLNNPKALAVLQSATEKMIEVLKSGNKILLCGNGGSAADAQHIAAEITARFYFDRPGLPAIALTTDTSALTAISNDYSYERVFSRQVEALGKSGDLLIAISTSGNSPSILAAVNQAKSMGIVTVGMTGKTGGKMNDLCDFMLKAESTDTPRIQETHSVMYHIFCGLIEERIFPEYKNKK